MRLTPRLGPSSASRRAFLRQSGLISVAAGAAPLALNLAAMGEACAAGASDYKALVCVFLDGGNDDTNTLVPYDQSSYDTYFKFRSDLAIARSIVTPNLLTPTTPLADGRQFALAPGMAPLVPLFQAGKMAVVLNVGALIQPTSKAQYEKKTVRLPPQLFSHNDQVSYWQASATEGATSGWGGRLGDIFASGNGNANFTCMSASGNAVFLSGRTAVQYQVSPTAPVSSTNPVDGIRDPLFGSKACSEALLRLMTGTSNDVFESEYSAISRRSIEAGAQLASALKSASVKTRFPSGNPLADQLSKVAQLIAARDGLGVKRQVFFVTLPGFDTHSGLLATHPGLMEKLGSALSAFYQATVELGVASQVTTFTGSEFGRALVSNSGGSFHGWGGMQFVMGDSVRGRSFVGTAPVLANNGPDDVGEGRLLPSISVEQFGATLATWFGVPASDLPTVLPNLVNFNTRDLGFMT